MQKRRLSEVGSLFDIKYVVGKGRVYVVGKGRDPSLHVILLLLQLSKL